MKVEEEEMFWLEEESTIFLLQTLDSGEVRSTLLQTLDLSQSGE